MKNKDFTLRDIVEAPVPQQGDLLEKIKQAYPEGVSDLVIIFRTRDGSVGYLSHVGDPVMVVGLLEIVLAGIKSGEEV